MCRVNLKSRYLARNTKQELRNSQSLGLVWDLYYGLRQAIDAEQDKSSAKTLPCK